MSRRLLVFVIAVVLPLIPILVLIRQSSSGVSSITDRAAQLQPLTGAQLHERSDGEEVLVEGLIAAQTPIQFQAFVAYERQYSLVDNDLGRYWRTEEQITPPLWITLADGVRVRVLNNTYQLRHLDSTRALASASSAGNPGRSIGLQQGDRVTVIGRVTLTAAGPALTAYVVAGGSHAEWLAAERGIGAAALDGLAVAGIVVGVVALALWWLTQHRPHRIAPTGV